MKRERIRSREGRSILDDALIALASSCAVYSGGQAVASNEVAFSAVVAVLLGTVISGILARVGRGRRWLAVDGFLYLGLGLVAYFGARILNSIFPPDTFPPELMPSSWLVWMMVFGSFVLWRDSTLLFQAIPPLALFGFVGCYDTFRPVVFFFFAYLVCVATLFARAHSRDMALRAERSGFFGGELEALRRENALVDRLRSGPWRWAAGPDWALGSAAVIVLLSFIGAPVIRQTVKPISGIARIGQPRGRPTNGAVTSAANVSGGSTRIARGPVRLRNLPAFESSVTDERYFRTESFYSYSLGVWSKGGAAFWNLVPRFQDLGVKAPPESPAGSGTPKKGGSPSQSAGPLFIPPASAPTAASAGSPPDYLYRVYTLPDGSTLRGAVTDSWRLPLGLPASMAARPIQIKYRIGGTAAPIPGQPVFPAFSPLRDEVSNGFTPAGGEQRYIFVPPSRPRADARLAPYRARGSQTDDPALDATTASTRLVAWAREVAGEGLPGARAERLRAAIARQIRYNINASAAEANEDPVDRALFTSHEGYCDVFASSMVLGARSLGIPARYAVGYYGEPGSITQDGNLVLLESDAHAWAELYFADLGWVPYDATVGAAVSPGGGRREGGDSGVQWKLPDAKTLLIGLGVLLLAAGGVLLLWPRPRGERALIRRRDTAVSLFARAVGEARGKPRRLDETLAEHVAAANLLDVRPEAETLLGRIEADLYAGSPADPGALEKEVHSFRRSLRAALRAARRSASRPR